MPLPLMKIVETGVGFADRILGRVLGPEKMSEEERSAAVLKAAELIEERDNTLISAQRDVIIAELQQGDKWTKRARPSIIYIGLFAVVFNHVFLPFISRIAEWIALAQGGNLEAFTGISPIALPADFWYVWGGVCSVYALGRTAEKRGARNQLIGWITGNKQDKEGK